MKNLANEIELKVMVYFQERIGFQNWWDSLAPHIQGQIENGLIDTIESHLSRSSSGRANCCAFPQLSWNFDNTKSVCLYCGHKSPAA